MGVTEKALWDWITYRYLLSFIQTWNKRRSHFIDYTADKCQKDIPTPDDEKEALQLMFRNTRATETIPKVRRVV